MLGRQRAVAIGEMDQGLARLEVFRMASFSQRVKAILLEVLDAPPGERDALIDARCGGEARLLEEVRALLAAGATVAGEPTLVSHASAMASVAGISDPALDPGSVPSHRLIEAIGEGGFGLVFLAEQLAPVHRERVAVKVLKPGMDSRRILERFDLERRTLARFDHPGLATIFDAGATDRGLPYFSMEYVHGVPITGFSRAESLGLRPRLELFLAVCDAVQHAHQKGVIHRDIKPSNILVTLNDGEWIAKVIDFGIAKAMEESASERMAVTEQGQMLGTPQYMSPEQACMGADDIDIRTDVYSLGVVLYELLTGTPPLRLDSTQGFHPVEVSRTIRDAAFERPSSRLVQHASDEASPACFPGGTSGTRLIIRELRRDLDWVVMRCLEKDRTRRYPTVNALAADVRRYLSGQPVDAGPPTAAYRLAKFTSRHRVALAVTMLVATVLVGAALVSVRFGIRAARDRDIANAVSQFLNSDVLDAVAVKGSDAQLRMTDVLEAADRAAAARFADRPLLEAEVRTHLAAAFTRLGDFGSTARQLTRIDEIRAAAAQGGWNPSVEQILDLESMRAESEYRLQPTEAGLQRIRSVIRESDERLGPRHSTSIGLLNQLGGTLKNSGQLDDAEDVYNAVGARWTEAAGSDSEGALVARHNLALVELLRGDSAATASTGSEATTSAGAEHWESAVAQLTSVAAEMKRSLGDTHPVTVGSLAEIPPILHRLGRFDEAEARYTEVLPLLETVLGDTHWRTLDIRANLGTLYFLTDRPERAIETYVVVLPQVMRRYGPAHLGTRRVALRLATAYARTARPESALRTVDTVVRAMDDLSPPIDPDIRAAFLDGVQAALVTEGVAMDTARWVAPPTPGGGSEGGGDE